MNVSRHGPIVTLAVLIAIAIAHHAHAVTWYVDKGNTGAQDGTSWATAFTAIQPAIDAASSDGGGEVWVAAAVYDEARQSVRSAGGNDNTGSITLAEGVYLYGGFTGGESARDTRDPEGNPTIIDGATSRDGEPALHVVIAQSGVNNATFDGFTVRNGLNPGGSGGGMHIDSSSLTIQGCTILDNTASTRGGGIYIILAAPSVTDCTFEGNSAASGGALASVFGSGPTVTGCLFVDNEATDGGAVYNDSSLNNPDRPHELTTFTDNVFESNRATEGGGAFFNVESPLFAPSVFPIVTIEGSTFLNNSAIGDGGGIFSTGASILTIRGCEFTGNSAFDGGALYNEEGASPLVVRSVFNRNSANLVDGSGGAIQNFNNSSPQLLNCIMTNNAAFFGGAMYSDSESTATLINCTIAENVAIDSEGGGGIASDESTPEIFNTIIWNNHPDQIRQFRGVPAEVMNSIVEGGFDGTNVLDEDPLLTNPALGGARLLSASPAIDAGASVVLPEEEADNDFFGTARPQGAGHDIGAYEFLDGDNDSLPDEWETLFGLNPGTANPSEADSDSDGLLDLLEYQFAFNPQDSDDPPSDFHVAEDGSDAEGDGSLGDPWETIAFGMSQARAYASAFHGVTLHVGSGTFEEAVSVASHVTLSGDSADTTTIQFFDADDTEHIVVEAGEGARLENIRVSVPGGQVAVIALLRIRDVSAEIDGVTLDGNSNTFSVGVIIEGTGSSDSVIRNSTIRRVQFGVRATNTAAVITRNRFEAIDDDALFIELPIAAKGPTETPRTGDDEAIETTGFNQFRSVDGFLVNNRNPDETQAEVNDWGIYTEEEISEKVSGVVDFTPFIGKSIGPGTVAAQLLDDNGTVIPPSLSPTAGIPSLNIIGELDDKSGIVLLPAVPEGTYTLETSASGFIPVSQFFSIDALEIVALSIPLIGGTTTDPTDVDGSGTVDAVDVQLTINAALGLPVPSGTISDVDGNGITNAIDIQLVINAALGV
jgi:predicted outer membrane repeat protein